MATVRLCLARVTEPWFWSVCLRHGCVHVLHAQAGQGGTGPRPRWVRGAAAYGRGPRCPLGQLVGRQPGNTESPLFLSSDDFPLCVNYAA